MHLNTFNQFQIWFKLFYDFKTQCSDDLTPVFAPTPLHYRRVQNNSFIELKHFWGVYCADCWSLNTNKWSFWKINNCFYHDVLAVLVESRDYCTYTFWIVNTMERKIQIMTIMFIHVAIRDYLLFMFFSFMIDYIKFQLAWPFLSKAIITCGLKKPFYEPNSSDIIRSETMAKLL